MSERTTLVDPASAEPFTDVARAHEEEVDEAVARARAAQIEWAALSPSDRGRLLRRFAEAVDAAAEELAMLEVRNAGHTVTNAKGEAANVRDVLLYYSGAPERLFGRQIPVGAGVDLTFKEPLGIVGVIAPWNFPMSIAAWGFAPALAAGNAVVLKPAELTPLTAVRLAEIGLEAGLPENLFQTVTGAGEVAGWRMVTNPQVAKICFTGSTEIGRKVMAGCADGVKRLTLELGGKSANMVFADCDLERAASSAPYGVFDNAGQDCCARSRILVERSAFDRFMALLEPAVKAVKVLHPSLEESEMGPLISEDHRRRVSGFVTDEVPVAFRGEAPGGPGFWFPPTVLGPLRGDERVATEEIFGPVVGVIPFEDEADAVRLANCTRYGLSGSIWTCDLGRAMRVARAVQSGNLSVNSNSSVRYWTPFGGFKESGIGRELGPDALDSFTDVKNVFFSTEV